MPDWKNSTGVKPDFEFRNCGVSGPLTMLHERSRAFPTGRPSSVTVTAMTATSGTLTVWSGPALTTGGSLWGVILRMLIVTWSVVVSVPSVAVSARTYVPTSMNLAVVDGELTLAKVTGAGPLTSDQVDDSVLPGGRPSSVAVPDSATYISAGTIFASAGGPNAVCSQRTTRASSVDSKSVPFQRTCHTSPVNSSVTRMSPTMSLNCDAEAPYSAPPK